MLYAVRGRWSAQADLKDGGEALGQHGRVRRLEVVGSPEAVQHLPGPVKDIVIASFTDAMQMVFLVGVPVAVAGFLAVLALKELPLRSAPVERFPAETPTGPQTSVIMK